ncbi:MAG TPA: FHA domain-containing protein [Acidimicrobiales bacterium]|nr:FHA domain-containing protein [Acidimicrobiales bacterium]
MSENMLALLRICLLALLYLFFLRVVRAAWAEIRGPRPARPKSATADAVAPRRTVAFSPVTVATGTLTIIEPPEQRGRSFDLTEELTVGRAPGCQVSLEGDTFVSQLHARVFTRDGALYVEDLGSTNGTLVNRRKIKSAVALHQGDTLQVGRTILEVG